MSGKNRVCVIGAGTGGLCAARNARNCNMNVVIFEQSDQIGGTWVYTDNYGKDEFGNNVHSSMYKGLYTNLPKEIMGYPDFPIPEQKNSYISSEDVLEFLNLYADKFDIKRHIKFRYFVERIRPINDEWEVIVKNLTSNSLETFTFDYILVCNGHYHTPNLPHFTGMENYRGKQMHSHDYKCADLFKDESVLVIGAGPSGMDLCYSISKLAKRVTLSHHMNPKPKTEFPSNVKQKPDVLKLTENGVEYIDGTKEDFSVIFYCTGYNYAFPFLSAECGIVVEDNYIQPLYKHCINIQNPSMAFIGIPFYVCAAQMMDLQSRFVMKYYSGEKKLPSKAEMFAATKKEMTERWNRGLKKRQAHMMGPDQENYYNDLSRTGGIVNLPPVMAKLHNTSSDRFNDDLINFRKDIFKIIDNENFLEM